MHRYCVCDTGFVVAVVVVVVVFVVVVIVVALVVVDLITAMPLFNLSLSSP